MKTINYLILTLFISQLVFAQSIVIGNGASIEVGAGADICAGVYGNITGNLFGDGTQCNQTMVTTFQLAVNVNNGWNMVSVPGLHPTNQNVGTWWPHLTGTVWGYNGVQYVAASTATPGEGYWMKNTIAETYDYPAIQIVAHNPIPAVSGWNMIGGYEDIVATNTLTTNPPGQITGTIWGYNGLQYVAAANLVPGYSYWVKVLSVCDIIIPEALAKGNEVAEIFKEDWGRIIFTDNAGNSYVLYAADEESDLSLYELPPAPPSGMFDIRFTSGRIAEDINNSIQKIEMSGVQYPLTVRVENINIRLQDEMGSHLNVVLKSGENIVLNDATISKLTVSEDQIPETYALEQNYPNPFNPSTTIRFSLPKATQLKISIYNMLGEQIATIAEGMYESGYHKVVLDATNLSSGTYIYRLESSEFVQVKKMVLIK